MRPVPAMPPLGPAWWSTRYARLSVDADTSVPDERDDVPVAAPDTAALDRAAFLGTATLEADHVDSPLHFVGVVRYDL